MNIIKKFINLCIVIAACNFTQAMEIRQANQDSMEIDTISSMDCDEDEKNYLPVELEFSIANYLSDLTVSIDQIINDSKNIIEAIRNINKLFFNVSNINSTFKASFSKNFKRHLNDATTKIANKFGGKEEYIKVLLGSSEDIENVKLYLQTKTAKALIELKNALRNNELITIAALIKTNIYKHISSSSSYQLYSSICFFLLRYSSKKAMNVDQMNQKNIMENDEILPSDCDEDEKYYLPIDLEFVITNYLSDLTLAIDQIINDTKSIIEAIRNINKLFFNVSNINSTFKASFSKHFMHHINYAASKLRKKFGGKEEYIKVLLQDSSALEKVKQYVRAETKNAKAEFVNALAHDRLIAIVALARAGIDNYIDDAVHEKGDFYRKIDACLIKKRVDLLKLLINNFSSNKLKKELVANYELRPLFLERTKCIYERYYLRIMAHILTQYPQAEVHYLEGYSSFRIDLGIDLGIKDLNGEKFREFKNFVRELDIPIKIKCKNLNNPFSAKAVLKRLFL